MFYLGLAVPCLIFSLINYRATAELIKQFYWLFALVAVVSLLDMQQAKEIKRGLYLLLFFISCVLVDQGKGRLKYWLLPFSLTCLLMLFYITADWIWIWSHSARWIRYSYWLNVYFHPSFFAMLMCFGLLIGWMLFLGPWLEQRYQKTGYILGLAVVFMVLGGMLYRKTHWRRYLPPLLVLLILLYVFFSYYAGYEFSGRGLTARDEIWLSTWNSSTVSVKTFLFGHGAAKALEAKALSTGQVVYNTHSVYLEALYRYGAVGLALLLVIMLGALNILYKTIKHHEYGELAVFWLATLVSGSIVMIVELNGLITTPNLLWHWLWMPVAFALFCQVNLNKGTS
ncbi:O-antigen ligase family protein [Thiopseudomonas alkaliphila]|uniref:O-antigen ligase family protein n=1 Tax=Thiopseudomonas alkaliphila TaxID=1697053 RepID=UPI00130E46A9|nr:O-antigen ligase family protein [Thiopseudomonas alkaliphila]